MKQESNTNNNENLQDVLYEFATKNETTFLIGAIVSLFIEMLNTAKRAIWSR